MENYGKAMELAESATESEGAAMEKYNIYQDSMAAGLDRINALWETFIINLGEDDVLKNWVSLFEELMKIVSSKEFTTFLTWGTLPITIAVGVAKLVPAIKTITAATDEAAIASAKLTRSWSTFAIVVASIALAVQVITYIATAQDRLRGSLDETIESINSVDSELESLEDELNSINEQIDEIAEHILILGGQPLGTVKDYLDISTIKEAENKKIKSAEIFKRSIGRNRKSNCTS